MKITLAKTLVAGIAAAALLGALPSVAAEGKTRAQVRAEYDEAVRNGDIVEPNTGLKFNELYPAAYPQKEAGAAGATAKTRSAHTEKQDADTKAN